MAQLRVDGDALVVRLAWWERAAARRREVRVPLATVTQVAVTTAWWRPLRGARVSGTMVPGSLCLGIWRHAGGRDFVAIRHRHARVVFVELRPPSPYTRISVSGRHADRMAEAVRAAMGPAAAQAVGAAGP
ncbi:hypothetical protein [Streptomyces sp. NPDC051211]|uniref:hypothetical protein n=1 Tax=Streptomyces sp. NPDC051211 TaxID=3154643 RepID=UPI00344F1890